MYPAPCLIHPNLHCWDLSKLKHVTLVNSFKQIYNLFQFILWSILWLYLSLLIYFSVAENGSFAIFHYFRRCCSEHSYVYFPVLVYKSFFMIYLARDCWALRCTYPVSQISLFYIIYPIRSIWELLILFFHINTCYCFTFCKYTGSKFYFVIVLIAFSWLLVRLNLFS